MKNIVKILVVLIILGVIGGFIYWQYNKKRIISDSVEKAITKKTDSLYYVHYDSSIIDEINGDVAFFNVVLQSDSAEKEFLKRTDSLPAALYNIRVGKIAASGIDVAGLLQQQNVAAKKILLIKPVVQIINTGMDKPRQLTMNDTLELYKKILGKFNSIKADTIQVVNGTVLMTNKDGVPQTTLENINISLNNFLVDSTKDYESIIGYFIKDVHVTIDNIQLPPSNTQLRINLEKLDYNAAKRTLSVGSVKQYRAKNMDPIIDLSNIRVTDLNTDAFILQQRLKAGLVSCDGGVVTIYQTTKKSKSGKGEKTIELSSDLIDQAQVSAINLGKTRIVVINQANPNAKPFVLNNVTFAVLTPVKIIEGTTLNNLVNNAEWAFSADGFSVDSKDGVYRTSFGNFTVNNQTGKASISNFSLKPLISEQQFIKRTGRSKDLYNFSLNNIQLDGINIKRLFGNSELEVSEASFQPKIKVFNDKTLPSDTISKVGKYPHQAIVKLDFGFYIKTLKLTNGDVSYRERGPKSGMIGNVFFTAVNATVSNITNIPARIKANPLMTVEASAKFLGESTLSSRWQLPLNSTNGRFHISGELQRMNAMSLNKITRPLGMASIKQGTIDKVTFDMEGSDTKGEGEVLFLYHDLKLDILKQGDDEKELSKKGFISLLANTIIKNKNDQINNKKSVSYDRVITKSFFNLIWKTIYTGVKNTAIGKKGS
jgi:hypothetical protein